MASYSDQIVNKVQSRGQQIMAIAEMLRPSLMDVLMGCHDEQGLAVQPARIRGIALNMAQEILRRREMADA